MSSGGRIAGGALVSGGGGGGGKGGGQPYNPTTARDGLDSTQYAKVIDLISEGEIQGLKNGHKSIYINNTPLQNADGSYNFQDVAVYTTNGTQGQAAIPISSNVESEVGVGTTVLNGLPVIKSITNPNVDAVRLTISIPQLQGFTDKGDIIGASVQLQIAVQYAGGGFTTVVDDTITGRTGDLYQKNYLINFTGARPVDIRVTRVTADSTDPKLTNAFSWASYTEITNARLRYPNSALVGLRINAQQFSSIPSRSYLVRGVKVKIPSNATVDQNNGRLIYSGVWNGTFGAAAWCSDPAMILLDLLTSTRYGFGDHIKLEQLDKWSFYSASQYASQLVDSGHRATDGSIIYEPRFSCNVNIQNAEEAYKLINNLCSVMRCMPYWGGGTLTISQDRPTDPSYLLTSANTGEGGINYQNSSQKTRPTVAVVSYLDLGYYDPVLGKWIDGSREIAYEAVEDAAAIAKYGVVTTQLTGFGCTSRGQAARVGRWLLYEEQNSEVASTPVDLVAGTILRPGTVISNADPLKAGSRRGGRIISATTSAITADSTEGLSTANSPTLSVILPDGTVQVRPVADITGDVITVSPAFGSAPNPNSIWVFESTDLQASTWRVLGVTEQDDGCSYGTTMVSYDASKYSYIENGTPLQPRDITNLNELPAAPTNLAFAEALYTYQAQVRAKVIASWKPVLGVSLYEVRWRKDQGNWTTTQQPSVDFEILDITPGLFEFQVYSLNATFKPSVEPLAGSITALGKTAPPSDVESFAVTLDPSVGITLSWPPVTDLDLQGYEIWDGPAWGVGTLLGVFNATSKKLGLPGAGTTTWWIKALDTSGSYSTNAISASVTITGAPAPTTSGSFGGENFILAWGAIQGSLATSFYEVRYGSISSTWATATSLGTVKGTTFTTKAAWVGTCRFFVAAVDLINTMGAANYFDSIVIAPTQPTIATQVVDNNVLLYWNDCTQTLPIESYELRKGATWETAQVIGTKQGKFTTVFETASGTFTYWLAGIDVAGNYGSPGSVTTSVSQPPDYVLKLDQNSTFSGSKTNAAVEGGVLLVCVNTAETWQSHFTARGWNTPQDQINAGFAYFAMPSQSSGQYVEEIDYGTVLASSKISTVLTTNNIAGTTSTTPTLAYKKLSGDPWTTYAGVSSVFATDFRYFRAQWDFASTGGDDLLRITGLNVKLDSKLKNDSGTGTANAADSGGTAVSFGVAFVDIDSISVTPLATSSVVAVYDFVDSPNPTSFKVLLFNSSGTRISGAFSWSARGV